MADKIPDEIWRVAHGLYADAQQRHNVTDIARALMARDKRTADRIEALEAWKAEAMEVLQAMLSPDVEEVRKALPTIRRLVEKEDGRD